jgi:hypothetical protein
MWRWGQTSDVMPLKALADLCSGIIVYREMTTVPPSTIRVRKLRERRSKGVAMVAPVEVGEGGIDLLVGNGLLDHAMENDRQAAGKACLAALEQWAVDRGGLGAP